ncbi:hypothetical protein [Aeromonas media]|uniref:hypothetical protein n=1 Tax=Aeromonas media TaxID=651 RepID=UPI0038D21428
MTSLHPNATTTVEQRKFIQDSELTVSELADMLGVSERTVRRWKGRKATEDYSHTPHRLPTKLTEEQQWFLIEIHNMLRLKLDDLLCIARAFVLPTVSRSALYRCLDRHGETNIKDPLHDIPAKTKQRLQINKPGFVEITERLLPEMPGDTYMLVAKDRTSHCVYIEMHERKDASNVMAFLKNVKAHFPFHIRVLSVDQRLGISNERPALGETEIQLPPFASDINLIFPKLKWMLISNALTMDNEICLPEIIFSYFHKQSIDLWADWKEQLIRYVYWYNHHVSLHSLKQLTPWGKLKRYYEISPDLFIKKPLQSTSLNTHLFKDVLYNIFYSLKLIKDDTNDKKPENIKHTRKGYVKQLNDFQSHQEMFDIYMPLFFNTMHSLSDVHIRLPLFRYQVLECLYLEIASTPIITPLSDEKIKECYIEHVLLPIVAVAIFSDFFVHVEQSFLYHIDRVLRLHMENIETNNQKLHFCIKKHLRKYISDLNFCDSSGKYVKSIARLIKDIGPNRIQNADTIEREFKACSTNIMNGLKKKNNDTSNTDTEERIELSKLSLLKTAYLAMALISRIGCDPVRWTNFVCCYQGLICNNEFMTCIKIHLQELFSLENLVGRVDAYQFDELGKDNLKLQFAPLLNCLLTPVIRELSVAKLQTYESLVHQLKDLFSISHQFGSATYDRTTFKPITDIDAQGWSYRTVFFPYAYLIKILNCIQDNKLNEAYELVGDAPYGACKGFGFLPYAFSALFIGLSIRLGKNTFNNDKLIEHSNYIITGQGLFTTSQRSPIAISQLINNPYTNEQNNTLISTTSNIQILRAVNSYNHLVLKLGCTNDVYVNKQYPQAIHSVLDRLYTIKSRFMAELEKIPPTLDNVGRAEFFMKNTKLTNKDLHGEIIPFLKGSSFKNCTSEHLLLIEFLCGPSYTPKDIAETIQFANQHQSIALIYDAHNPG